MRTKLYRFAASGIEALEGPPIASEFLASSISSGEAGEPRHANEQEALSHNPNIRLVNNHPGHHLFLVSHDEWRAEIKAMNPVDRPNGDIRTPARFQVAPNRPGPSKFDQP